MENLRDNLRETIHRYHKDVMVVETAYPSRDIHPSGATARNMIWPLTPEGQKEFLADVIRTVKEAPERHGIGVNYWHPESTYFPNSTDRRRGAPDANSLFDTKGSPLPAMNVFGLQPQVSTSAAPIFHPPGE
jgi:arabinogalactan endo-1,4-beta-galactosidase